jgi:hypothetical protein
MTTDNRPEPPSIAGEQETLAGFLDFQRATLLWKLEGLDDQQLRRAMVPSGTSLLGLVKHLAYVERSWFQGVWAGQEVSFPWTKEDPDADWRIEPDESTQDILGPTTSSATAAARSSPMRPPWTTSSSIPGAPNGG